MAKKKIEPPKKTRKPYTRKIVTPEPAPAIIETVNDNAESEILAAMAAQEDYTPAPTGESKQDENKAPENENKNDFINDDFDDRNELNDAFTELLDPAVIITAFDGIMCFIASFVFKFANVDADPSAMALTAAEKNSLKPSVKGFIKTLNLNLTPTTAMLLSIGLIYSSKIAVIITNDKLTNGKATVIKQPRKTTPSRKRGKYNKRTKIEIN
jgi:hypothetical protein